MTRFLKALGLMTVREHERIVKDRFKWISLSHDEWQEAARGWQAKFKKAITDLEGEVRERKRVQYDLACARLEIEQLTADALAMRRKRQMDRERRKGVAR